MGLSRAIIQSPVSGLSKDRFLGLGWPDHHVVAEFDGRTKYRIEEDVFLERLHQDELESLGWKFFQAMWSSLNDIRTRADRLLSMFPLEVISRLPPVAELQSGGLWGKRPPGVLVPWGRGSRRRTLTHRMRPPASRTYFPVGDCVLPQTTERGPQ